MKIKWQRIAYLMLIIVFLGAIFTSVYYLLGGFEPIEIYRIVDGKRIVVGKQFNTMVSNDEPRIFFEKCQDMLEADNIDGKLTVISYANDTLQRGEIAQFIGIELNGDMAEIPRKFEVLELDSAVYYKMFLTMHPLVHPRTINHLTMLQEEANKNNEKLIGHLLTTFYPDNSKVAESWVANQ